jgi:hypothetical protein
MLANWVRQRVLAATTGSIALGAAVDSFVSCDKVFMNDGKVHYSIEDGLNRETGVGTYIQSSNTLVRDDAFETLINGVYNNNVLAPMQISNEAIVMVSGTVQGLTTHVPVWKDLIGFLTQNASTSYLTPDVKPFAGTIETYMFRDDLVESLSVQFDTPHDIQVGAIMVPHIRWSPNTNDVGTVRWGIEYVAAELNTGIFKDSITLYFEQAAEGILDKLQIVESVQTVLANEPDTVITGRIFRDATHANDTFVGDVALHVACLHYQANAVGTPSKDPDFYNWS